MKKKLFVLSVLSLVLVVVMFALMFIPMTNGDAGFDGIKSFTIFNVIKFAFVAPSFFSFGFAYPIIALIFAVFIVMRAIKNIILSKKEDETDGKKFSVRCLWILLVVAFYGWLNAFLVLGKGEGDMPGIIKAAIFYFIPVIALMVVNGRLKKLTTKKVETTETK